MEKILVISYRFPPADETGTLRTWALAKYMKDMGYYPIFVTRNWSHPLKKLDDMHVPVGEKIEHEKNENYEVFILPHKNLLKLRIHRQFKSKHTYIRQFFNLIDYILMLFGIFWLNEYNAFIKKASEIAAADPSIRKAIVITDPYPLFSVGYFLHKRFGIKWLADYRDDWNTRQVNDTYNFKPTKMHRFVQSLTRKMEQKWVKTASFVTSVSDEYTNRIARFVDVPGHTIYNGFFEEDYAPILAQPKQQSVNQKFTIVHNGSLYPQQAIEPFLNAFKRVVDEHKDKVDIIVKFLGVTYKPGSKERIESNMKGYEKYVTCTDRISQRELFNEIHEAQLALLISFGREFKGLATSKIFDYLALHKPVLCFPPDGDVVEKILTETRLGYLCENEADIYDFLKSSISNLTALGEVQTDANEAEIMKYSRKNQTKKIVSLIASM